MLRPIILEVTQLEAQILLRALCFEEPVAWTGSYVAALRDRLRALVSAHDEIGTKTEVTK